MKNRKSLLGIGIFALVLVLSVGYAVVGSVELNVGGSVAAVTQDLKVAFTSASPTTGDVKGDVTNGLNATITATNLILNNPVTVTYVVSNSEVDVDATITEKAITNDNSEYFSVSTNAKTGVICNANSTKEIEVTVTLIKTPVAVADNSATIGVSFTAAPINNAN